MLALQHSRKSRKRLKRLSRMLKESWKEILPRMPKKNPKAFYSYIKKKTSNKVTVGPLKNADGNLVVDDKEMAEILNNHY